MINDLLKTVSLRGGSDLHLTVNSHPIIRLHGNMVPLTEYPILTSKETKDMAYSLLDKEKSATLEALGDIDFAFEMGGIGRFRANIYKQKGNYTLALRLLASKIPTMDSLKLPDILKKFAMKPRGLVLVTGPTGSGKSTTLAAMVNYINTNRKGHILTIEDPIEYIHTHGNCIVNQREVGYDTKDFPRALRSALRQDPDVILLGEMRDLETIKAAVTAAETGHLVLATLHTNGAANTVDRIIDIFPSDQQRQIRVQLANIIEGIVTQNLVPRADNKGRVLAMEILPITDAIRNMIREEKVHQITSAMQTGISNGMQPLDFHLANLVKQGEISMEEGKDHAINVDTFNRYLRF